MPKLKKQTRIFTLMLVSILCIIGLGSLYSGSGRFHALAQLVVEQQERASSLLRAGAAGPVEIVSPLDPVLRTEQNAALTLTRTVAYEQVVTHQKGQPRGYLTTPQELALIRQKANQGIEPYQNTAKEIVTWADKKWKFKPKKSESCKSANHPTWNDNDSGTPILYANALAYHLTEDERYAEEVKNILQQIMSKVETIQLDDQQCQLNFGWGTPELVVAADLIEGYWADLTCEGPLGTLYTETELGTGSCKVLFQNWLIKNPYYVVSYAAAANKSNWGAAATNATAYIADYLWDRPTVYLLHRHPRQINGGKEKVLSPREAYAYANQLMLERMNGYGVEYASSNSCDYLDGAQQSSQWLPVKSQISERGIIPEDARRDESCNVPQYNGDYQNYPQIHLGHNIQQCELMLRRGNRACYDNVDHTDLPAYSFVGPDSMLKTTHLYPGRGSIERAIKAIIIDATTEWRHESALEVAYRYYYRYHTLPGFEQWAKALEQPMGCDQDICFGKLTHTFPSGETPKAPPSVPPP